MSVQSTAHELNTLCVRFSQLQNSVLFVLRFRKEFVEAVQAGTTVALKKVAHGRAAGAKQDKWHHPEIAKKSAILLSWPKDAFRELNDVTANLPGIVDGFPS